MFKKVLVANRGEIAVRILRACAERGLQTVAVYSDADRTSLHVRYADQAFRIGPAPARESYLNTEVIIETALAAGADAIHPGYGFLSENADFAQAVGVAGIAWIGPPPEAMRAMGDKVNARRLMIAAGVPVIPGVEIEAADGDENGALHAAESLGFPLLVKASAGGGGKGMRQVNCRDELPGALESARREAANAFGNEKVYLEKVISRARHIEVQILADHHGNCIHLGERECSIQRRHQKLIEETPSVAVTDELREEMGAIAVRAARAVGYVNAGTLEFLLDREGKFYFLEMNTRLQVEHPITEMVTGVDIVKEQLVIAAGRRMRWQQGDVRFKGHAIECRISAENPYNRFLPDAGRITSLSEPTGPGVRLESGIYAGYAVSLFYDPLLAKLVVWGETRAEAILRMRRALEETRIGGIHTTVPFHQQVMDCTRFQFGSYDTGFVDGPDGFRLVAATDSEIEMVAAVAATLIEHQHGRQAMLLGTYQGSNGKGSNGRELASPSHQTSAWKQAGRLADRRAGRNP